MKKKFVVILPILGIGVMVVLFSYLKTNTQSLTTNKDAYQEATSTLSASQIKFKSVETIDDITLESMKSGEIFNEFSIVIDEFNRENYEDLISYMGIKNESERKGIGEFLDQMKSQIGYVKEFKYMSYEPFKSLEYGKLFNVKYDIRSEKSDFGKFTISGHFYISAEEVKLVYLWFGSDELYNPDQNQNLQSTNVAKPLRDDQLRQLKSALWHSFQIQSHSPLKKVEGISPSKEIIQFLEAHFKSYSSKFKGLKASNRVNQRYIGIQGGYASYAVKFSGTRIHNNNSEKIDVYLVLKEVNNDYIISTLRLD